MKTNIFKILIFPVFFSLLFISACDKKPTEPKLDNPFDPNNVQTGGDPFKLTAKIANGGITLEWTKPDFEGLHSYKIYRSEQEATGYSQLATATDNQTQYIDKSIENGHSYWYRVTVVNSEDKESKMTNSAGVNIKTEPLLAINGGAEYTASREVSLTILAVTATQMLIANNADFSGANWEKYATTKNWTLLAGEGQKLVYMKVKYDSTESSSLNDDIIMDTMPPTIDLTISPDSGITNETSFEFDPTASSDNLSPAVDLQIRFDYENDGGFDTDWHQLSIVNHQYSIGGGDKEVKMQLTDGAWQVDTTINIFVNTRPQVSFTATEDTNNLKIYYFDASASSDYEDGGAIEYRWDFNGDGSWDTGWLGQDTISYEYAADGDYKVKLTVRDQNSLSNETMTQVNVESSVTDIDGNIYEIVKIGEQRWMAENLKVTHYRNSEAIPNVTDNTEWSDLATGAYCSLKNDDGNIGTYGLLYNWYAVDDSRNIAPEGWHVPTDEEWKEMEMYLGMTQSDADNTRWRGTDEGGKLKEEGTTHWSSPNTGATNESGFSALPGRCRDYSGNTLGNVGDNGHWWSSSESGSDAWCRFLHYDDSGVYRLRRR